jgi:hypothetical protein
MLKIMNILNRFNIGDTVYLITDTEQKKWIVISITIDRGGYLSYEVASGEIQYYASEIELSKSKSLID